MDYRATILIRGIEKRARREGVEFDLDAEWLANKLRNGICEVSGLRFDFSLGRGPYKPSIDRVIAGGGYTQRNCRIVLWAVNAALEAWGLEAFLPIAKALVEKAK